MKHEPDALAAQPGALLVGQRSGIDAIDEVGAAGRLVEDAENVEQGRFAGAGGARDRKPVAVMQLQIDLDQRVHCGIGAELPADVMQFEHGRDALVLVFRHLAPFFSAPFSAVVSGLL